MIRTRYFLEKKADETTGSSAPVTWSTTADTMGFNEANKEGWMTPEAYKMSTDGRRGEVLGDIRGNYGELLKAPKLTKGTQLTAQGGPTTEQYIQQLVGQQMGGLQGYTSPEYSALREQQNLVNQRNEALARRQLAARQGAAGVGGAAATAQQAQMGQQMSGNRAALEQGLMVQNIAEQQRRQQAARDYMGQLLGTEMNVEKTQAFLDQLPALTMAGMAEGQLGRESMEKIAEETGSSGIAAAEAGKMCCFIFLEENDGILDSVARRARDELMTPKNRRGYYKLSEVLVPLMRRYSSVKFAVRWGMVKPMLMAGKWKYGQNKVGKLFAPVAYFWIGIFDYLGGDHPFRRENGEVV